jgi:two-component system, OmpR family, response regulator MtrA
VPAGRACNASFAVLVGPSPADVIDPNVTDSANPPARVLICEDEEPLRELIRVSLGDSHRFFEAKDGRTALELVREHRPDVIVLDVMLPGVSGLDVLRAVRSDPELADTRVVAISAWVHLEGEALAAGADGFVGKPFDPQELRSTVENLISGQ